MGKKDTVKTWFETGDKPTETQFHSFFDSIWFKDENLQIENIENLPQTLINKSDKQTVENHIQDAVKHVTPEEREAWNNATTKNFFYRDKTLRLINQETKTNLGSETYNYFSKGHYLNVFIELPHLRISNIRGILNVGTFQYVDINTWDYTVVTPKSIEFNTSLLSASNFTEDNQDASHLDFVAHSTISTDIDFNLETYYYGGFKGGNEGEVLFDAIRDLKDDSLPFKAPTDPFRLDYQIKFGSIEYSTVLLDKQNFVPHNPFNLIDNWKVINNILEISPDVTTTATIVFQGDAFNVGLEYNQFDGASFYLKNATTEQKTFSFEAYDSIPATPILPNEVYKISFSVTPDPKDPKNSIATIDVELVAETPNQPKKEGILIELAHQDYAAITESFCATLSDLEIAFQDDTDLDIEVFKNHKYLKFLQSGTFPFIPYEVVGFPGDNNPYTKEPNSNPS